MIGFFAVCPKNHAGCCIFATHAAYSHHVCRPTVLLKNPLSLPPPATTSCHRQFLLPPYLPATQPHRSAPLPRLRAPTPYFLADFSLHQTLAVAMPPGRGRARLSAPPIPRRTRAALLQLCGRNPSEWHLDLDWHVPTLHKAVHGYNASTWRSAALAAG
jgi:hypothetical protein